MYDSRTACSSKSIRRRSLHGNTRPAHSSVASSSTVHGSRHASPWSGSSTPSYGPGPGYRDASTHGTISSQPRAPAATNPSEEGSSTPMPWSRSSSPARRSEMMRPPCSGWISISQTPPRNCTAPRIVVSRRVRPLLSAAVALCLLSACSPDTATHLPSPSPTSTSTRATLPTPSPSPTPASKPHVFLIVMENRSYDQAMTGAYTAQLAAKYAVATNYHGVSHPSLPNYLALTSGSTWGIADDGWHPLPAGGLGAQLTGAGISWRAYMEGMSGTCTRSSYPYALKHDPLPYYGTTCPEQIVPLSQVDHHLTR